MKAIIFSYALVVFLLMIPSCNKIDTIRPALTIDPTQKDVDANQGNFIIAISATVKWTASCDKNWLVLDPASGTGDGIVQANFEVNSSVTSRTAQITFKGTNVEDKVLTVTQSGVEPILNVTPSNLSVSFAAGISTVDIVSNLSWSAASSQTWCALAQSSGTGNATLTISYQANTVQSPRTAIITITANGITNQTVQITQGELVPMLTVSPSSQIVSPTEGTISFIVCANLAWAASCGQPWCIIANPEGLGNSVLHVNYEQNIWTNKREAVVVVKAEGVPDQFVTVTQNGLIPSLSVSPLNRTVSSLAGNTTFELTSNTYWTVQSDQSWCSAVTVSGSGNAILLINYEANSTPAQRVAKVTISVTGLEPIIVSVIQQLP